MRHSKKVIKLGRKSSHRRFMLANMASSLIDKKRINTTLTKAKALKIFFEPLVTKSKSDTTHNRRIVFKTLRNKEAVSELFRNISKKIGDRPGGYTRIIKLGNRMGDNASMAMIELVDYNEVYKLERSEKKKSTRRGRRGKKKIDNVEKDKQIKNSDASLKVETNQKISEKDEERPTDQSSDQEASKKDQEKPTDQSLDQEASKKEEEKSTDQSPDQKVSKEEEEIPTDQSPNQKESEEEEGKSTDESPDQKVSEKKETKQTKTSEEKSDTEINKEDSEDQIKK